MPTRRQATGRTVARNAHPRLRLSAAPLRQHLHTSLRRPSARRHELAAGGELGPEPEGPVRLCWRAFPHVQSNPKT